RELGRGPLEIGRRRKDAALARDARRDGAPGDEPRRHGGELQGRCQHVALADRGADRLAGLPGNAVMAELPGAARDDALVLARHVEIELEAEAEAVRHRGDLIDAEALAHLVEEDVAGLLDGVAHVDAAVAALLPA